MTAARTTAARHVALLALVLGLPPTSLAVGTAAADGPTCQAYDPTKIQVLPPASGPFSDPDWRITSAGKPLELAASHADADRVAALALFYAVECRITSKIPDGSLGGHPPVVTSWQQPTRPLSLPFPEDCVTYDPSKLDFDYRYGLAEFPGGKAGAIPDGQPLPPRIPVPAPRDIGSAVLALSRQWSSVCVIGGWVPPVTAEMNALAEVSKAGRQDVKDTDAYWHPVFYWKK